MVYPALTCVHTDVFPVPLHVLTSQERRTRRHAPNMTCRTCPKLPSMHVDYRYLNISPETWSRNPIPNLIGIRSVVVG